MDKLLDRMISQARSGHRGKGLSLLKMYVDKVHGGEEPDQDLQMYLVDCLDDILDGKAPDEALNIKRGKGQPKMPFREKVLLAIRVEELARQNKANNVEKPVQKAIEAVADELPEGDGYETIRKYRDKCGRLANDILDMHERIRKDRESAQFWTACEEYGQKEKLETDDRVPEPIELLDAILRTTGNQKT